MRHRSCLLRFLVALLALIIAVIGICVAIIIFWPELAAQNVDKLRDVIGDGPVAQLEDTVLSIKDQSQQLEYKAGLVKPAAPWTDSSPDPATTLPTSTRYPYRSEAIPAQTQVAILPSPSAVASPTVIPAPDRHLTATSLPGTPTQIIADKPNPGSVGTWQPLPVAPLGNLAGEGRWLPYLYGPDGKTLVAYRTFLQADPLRPYSVTAIVAFDLAATRLHFVLGSIEPVPFSPQPSRTGTIPSADVRQGVLLATFNGGFKARHGHYGAMADGLIALPAIEGLATVAIYTDGHVQIGKWGTDIEDSRNLVAWRQNGEMLVHNGKINPATAQTSVSWGRTLKGGTITWRSALGISADGQTLYYVAGPQLDAPTVAKVAAQVGAVQALELDVNDYWVHFAAIRSNGSSLIARPLFEAMNVQADRYLKGWSRDFFYVTTATYP